MAPSESNLDLTVNYMGWKTNDYVVANSPELGPDQLAKIVKFGGEFGEFAYIHFCKRDRRNDMWIRSEYIDLIGHNTNKSKDFRFYASDFERVHKFALKVRNIPSITLGDNVMRCWYFSPYPAFCYGRDLYMCETCFRYFTDEDAYKAHSKREVREGRMAPPGREIYRKGSVSIFQIYGIEYLIECQCLSLLCKLFLDHKTLYYMDMENFLFYILCRTDERGCHLAAFFSKHVGSATDDILSCIVVLPKYQKMGYGSVLISLAYEIARRVDRPGGPEEPLSDMGEATFLSYWRDEIAELILMNGSRIDSVERICQMTGFTMAHIRMTLTRFKFVSGESESGELLWNTHIVREIVSKCSSKKNRPRIDPKCLIWLPHDDWDEYDVLPPQNEFQADTQSRGRGRPRRA